MKVYLATIGLLVACAAAGAELKVTDSDLPRVPATAPADAVATLQVRDGFRAELLASEPLVADPVAIAFDENGRMFVAEMRDYSERQAERLGRIKLLEDADGDGRFDKATIYATNLPWPTAVICWNGGIFVGASPDILYLKDIDGDGKADVRNVVFTGFGNGTAKLNVQQLLNSFTWGIDNRIHGALGGNPSTVTNMADVSQRPSLFRQRGEIDLNRDSRIEPLNRAGAPPASPFSPQRGDGLGMRGGSTSDREPVHGEGLRVRGEKVQEAATETQGTLQLSPLTPLRGEGERNSRVLELRGRDFSFDPRTLEMRAESGGGQWGMSFDDEANKFVCNNSRHIAVEMYEDRYAARNRFYSMPSPDVSIAVDGPAAEVFRLSPDEPWRVIRTKWRVAGLVPGPIEGGGRASGYFTGAAGAMIYRGDAFPPEFRGDAFIADCGSNLIHRKKIHRDGLNFIAERAQDEQAREFLASRDNWFRPVSFANAPDGALYIVDMYRETVEHPWSIPPELKNKLDLNSGNERGRIYRIVPNGFKQPRPVRLGDASTAELVRTLEHSNGWHRDTAARLLVERNDTNTPSLLRNLGRESTSAVARVHALQVLRAFGDLEPDDLKRALSDRDSIVRAHAVRNAESYVRAAPNSSQLRAPLPALHLLADDPDIRVRYALALAETDSVTLAKIIQRDVEDSWMRAAVLSGLGSDAADVFAALAGNQDFTERKGALEFLREAARIAGAGAPMNRVALGLRVAANSPLALTFASAFASGLERRNTTLAAVDSRLFQKLIEQARGAATNSGQPEPQRVEAAEFLGASYDAESLAALVDLLNPSISVPLQSAAVVALNKRRDHPVINVIAHWTQLALATRTKAVALLLSRRDTALALVRAVEQGTVARTELSAADVQRLTTYSDGVVRAKAREVFQRDASTRSEVVKKFQPALGLQGDAARGHLIYQQRCVTCHRAGAEGFAVGPDLASVAASGKEKLLVSILDPSAEVAAAYAAYSVETKDGESFVGVLAAENPLAVMLKVANGETLRLGRENIAALRGSDKSLMPEGLEERLSAQEMADLLEFVVRAKPAP